MEDLVKAVDSILDGEIDERVDCGETWFEVRVYPPTRLTVDAIDTIRSLPGVGDVLLRCTDSPKPTMHVRVCRTMNDAHRNEAIRARHVREARPKFPSQALPQKVNNIVHDLGNAFPCIVKTPTSSKIGSYTIEGHVQSGQFVSYDEILHFWNQYRNGSVSVSFGIAIPLEHSTEEQRDVWMLIHVQWRDPDGVYTRRKRHHAGDATTEKGAS